MATAFFRSREVSASETEISSSGFRVRVPASTSNCGPGFDTLGLAFELYNEVTLRRIDEKKVRYAGSDPRLGDRELAMIEDVAEKFFEAAGIESFGFSFNIEGEVPHARGLGSSVTVRAGILGGLNAIAGGGLSRHDIAKIVTDLEGHPDNAVAAVFGGFCVARTDPESGQFIDL